MHLVLVAGGLGSRLAPLTNHIPKFLVNIGKNTGYVEQIRYWDAEVDPDSITVIVHGDYKPLIEAYHKLYFPSTPLIVKTVNEANGSAHAILTTCQHLNGERVLFSWCDVLPNEPIPFDNLFWTNNRKNIVFTNYDGSCRYKIEHGQVQLDPENRGGVFGLYYVGEFSTDVPFKNGQDFVEILFQYGKLEEYELDSIIDFGDLPKLQRVRAKSDEAREFNSVEFIDDRFVLKQATNQQGKVLLYKESLWYETLQRHVDEAEVERPAVPNAWIKTDRTGFFLERVKGQSIWKEWDGLSIEDRAFVLRRVVEERQKIFNLKTFVPTPEQLQADVQTEAYTKLINRYDEIRDVIEAFGPINCVNGWYLKNDPQTTIGLVWRALRQHYEQTPVKYGFIHGDLQLSNSMVNTDDLTIAIIDPRGYFGKTAFYGLEDYDNAKLMYSLSGYDKFNYSKDFGITIADGEIQFKVPYLPLEGLVNLTAELFKPVHHLWLGVCWQGLAQYIKNDPVKSVAAHYHGLMLMEQALENL